MKSMLMDAGDRILELPQPLVVRPGRACAEEASMRKREPCFI